MPFPLLGFLGPMLLGGIFSPALEPFGNLIRQLGYRAVPSQLTPIQFLVTLRMREEITDEQFRNNMRLWGFNDARTDQVFKAQQFFPSAQDLVNWQSKEVFEPESVERYGLDDEFDQLELDLFSKAGVSNEQARNFWRAHWQHPSFTQTVEMLRRDVLTGVGNRKQFAPGSLEWVALRVAETEALYQWYRLVEIPPHWRAKLTAIGSAIPTRVDTRRQWDLRVISEEQILRNALDRGLDIDDARAEVLFAKVSTDFPDLMARYSNGWITSAEVLERLTSWGMPPDRAEELLQTRMDNLARPQRIARERDLTKAEIVKGVKNNIISFGQGAEMLEVMGYDKAEAQFVLDINVEAGESPETPLDFLRLVEGYKQSQGQESTPVPQSVRDAEKRVLDARAILDGKLADGTGGVGPASLELSTALLAFRAELQEARLPLTLAENYEEQTEEGFGGPR